MNSTQGTLKMENTNISDAVKEQNETANYIDQIKENSNIINKYLEEMKIDAIKMRVMSASMMFDYLEKAIGHYVRLLPDSNIKDMLSDTVKSELEYVKRNVIKDFNSLI